jgi:hypothetical protein
MALKIKKVKKWKLLQIAKISEVVTTAVLYMISASFLIFTYLINNKGLSSFYYLFSLLSFLSFVLSIFFGLYGSREIIENGNSNHFKTQTYTAIIGIILLIIALFIAKLNFC